MKTRCCMCNRTRMCKDFVVPMERIVRGPLCKDCARDAKELDPDAKEVSNDA